MITTKIAWLVDRMGMSPRSILAVTFTNKAAGEMRERVLAIVPHAQDVMVRTFHSFGAWFLRRTRPLPVWSRGFTSTTRMILSRFSRRYLGKNEDKGFLRGTYDEISRVKDLGIGADAPTGGDPPRRVHERALPMTTTSGLRLCGRRMRSERSVFPPHLDGNQKLCEIKEADAFRKNIVFGPFDILQQTKINCFHNLCRKEQRFVLFRKVLQRQFEIGSGALAFKFHQTNKLKDCTSPPAILLRYSRILPNLQEEDKSFPLLHRP